jgi:hypothetical protein
MTRRPTFARSRPAAGVMVHARPTGVVRPQAGPSSAAAAATTVVGNAAPWKSSTQPL